VFCDCSIHKSLATSSSFSSSSPSSTCHLSPLLDVLVGQASALVRRWYLNHQASLKSILEGYSVPKADSTGSEADDSSRFPALIDTVGNDEKNSGACRLCLDSCVEALRALALFPARLFHRVVPVGLFRLNMNSFMRSHLCLFSLFNQWTNRILQSMEK
jgi:hypothetical protein